jgi:hypothetical protein
MQPLGGRAATPYIGRVLPPFERAVGHTATVDQSIFSTTVGLLLPLARR